MSIEQARKILGVDGEHLTDEQIEAINRLQQAIARICILSHKKSGKVEGEITKQP